MKGKGTWGLQAILAVMAVLVFSGAAWAIAVEPDKFPEGTDISNAFANITLSPYGPGWDGHSPAIFAVNPATQREPFAASTGSLVFGTDEIYFPHLFRDRSLMSLRVDFAIRATTVSLDFIGNDGWDLGVLEAYDATGKNLDYYQTPRIGTNQVATATVSAIAIAYIEAHGRFEDSSIGIDNLNYTEVPIPASLILFGSGILVLLGLKQRG
jgi:hypothetical protein